MKKQVVSILVLLEILLQHFHQCRHRIGLRSFNPCFIGNPSATDTDKEHRTRMLKFQSLFYWKSFCNLRQLKKDGFTVKQFQSLFYWKSFCNGGSTIDVGEVQWVSILVLLEILLQQLKTFKPENCPDGFQSLFYWKSFCNQIVKTYYTQLMTFQSLFYWKSFCNE